MVELVNIWWFVTFFVISILEFTVLCSRWRKNLERDMRSRSDSLAIIDARREYLIKLRDSIPDILSKAATELNTLEETLGAPRCLWLLPAAELFAAQNMHNEIQKEIDKLCKASECEASFPIRRLEETASDGSRFSAEKAEISSLPDRIKKTAEEYIKERDTCLVWMKVLPTMLDVFVNELNALNDGSQNIAGAQKYTVSFRNSITHLETLLHEEGNCVEEIDWHAAHAAISTNLDEFKKWRYHVRAYYSALENQIISNPTPPPEPPKENTAA